MAPRKRTNAQLYETMRDAIAYMRAHEKDRPSPADVARAVGMSPSRFAHAFSKWIGISPKRFLSHLTHERAKVLIATSSNVLSASHKNGLSGPGRLHTLLVEHTGASPGEYMRGDIAIRYGIHPSPFGYCAIGITDRGICKISFLENESDARARQEIKRVWPHATLVRDDGVTAACTKKIFAKKSGAKGLRLFVGGTNFQVQVWKALLEIPEGRIVRYADIAKRIRRPRAVRAVGTAIGANPIAYLIPCHRVLTSGGHIGGYRWRPKRKETILAWEAARH